MSQATVYINLVFGIFFLGLISSQTIGAQAQCNGTGIPTLAKYNLLRMNMTEAQVAIVMGGTGAEQYQMVVGGLTQKLIQYTGPTVNYVSQGSISITFSNGRLTTKVVIGLCPTPSGQCSSAVIATRAKYNLLALNMTEAHVVTAMGGIGVEQSQDASGTYIIKSIQYTGVTVNYLPASLSLTFTNGLLTMKTALFLC